MRGGIFGAEIRLGLDDRRLDSAALGRNEARPDQIPADEICGASEIIGGEAGDQALALGRPRPRRDRVLPLAVACPSRSAWRSAG